MRVIDRGDDLFTQIKWISDESFTGDERPPELALRYVFDTGELFIHSQYGGPVSFAIVTKNGGQPYLWSLATFSKVRGLGFGSLLLKEVIAYYHDKAEYIDLSVNVNNPAQKLYFNHEFRVVKVLPKHYGEVNGLRMRRLLP